MKYNQLDLSVLKAITSSKKHALDFVNECDHRIFSPDVWNFANIVVGYIKTYKEPPTLRVLTDKMSKSGNSAQIEYLNEVWRAISSLSYDEKEFRYDLDKLKAKYVERQLSALKSKLDTADLNDTTLFTDVQRTCQNVDSITRAKSFERRTLKEAIPSFRDKFNARRTNSTIESKIKTGYSFLDQATNGIGSADFVIIAGESGFGKSLLLNNMGIQVWMQENTIEMKDNFIPGKNVLYFSLEMPYDDCFNRLLSRLSGVPSRKIENAQVSKEEANKIRQALDFISNYPYQFEIVDIPDASANDIEAILSDVSYNVDAVFIDYLGIMKPNQAVEESDWLKQGIIAYETRAIGRKFNLPVFTAVQLNRKSPTKDSSENIGLARLARSATIATHATTVIQIESRQNEELHPNLLLHIIKNRKGIKTKGALLKNLACATLLDSPSDSPSTDFTEVSDVYDISGEMEELEL
jgi:replicative DNA helicase